MRRYWITKDKQKLLISQMGIEHLRNVKKMLERKAAFILNEEICQVYSILMTLRGEMATYYAEREILRLEEMSPEEWLEHNEPRYEAICHWLEKKEREENVSDHCQSRRKVEREVQRGSLH